MQSILKENSHKLRYNVHGGINLICIAGSIVDNKTEGLTESSILLITASSISGVLLGLAIITIALCLIRNKTNIVKGHTTQQHHHRHHRDRTRDYFNPL